MVIVGSAKKISEGKEQYKYITQYSTQYCTIRRFSHLLAEPVTCLAAGLKL